MRREEVAARAFISTEYYTRIEQGRFVPSPEVLLAIARALDLSHDERQYVLDLVHADGRLPVRPSPGESRDDQLDPALCGFINALGSVPAMVVGSFTKILAWNQAAVDLFIDFSQVDLAERTCVHLIFTHETFKSRFGDVEDMQHTIVATLRASFVAVPRADQEPFVADLAQRSATFACLWDEHQVRQPRDITPTTLHHPQHGLIHVNRVVLRTTGIPETRLLFFPPR